MQYLEARDVVAVTHGRPGARVRPAHEWDLLDASLLETALDSPLRNDVLAEALECRRLVVPEAAALAAQRATTAEITDLEQRFERVHAAPERPPVGTRLAPELDFHRGVIDAARNRFIARVAMPLEVALASRYDRRRDAVAHQEAILHALRERDAETAREAMRTWLHALDRRARR